MKLSILIPCFNEERTIKVLLEKVIENISMNKPAAPPTIINKTKKEGTVQIALPPICELTTPTQTIAKK